MSEHELRDGLRAAVAEEPPLVLDTDELIFRARRRVRRRRALAGVGAATLAVVAAAVAIPIALRGAPAGTDQAAAGPPEVRVTSPAPTPGDVPWPPSASRTYSVTELQQRGSDLRPAMVARFGQAVPDAAGVTVRKLTVEAQGERPYLGGWIGFQRGGSRYSVAVDVFPPATGPTPAEGCGADGRCQVERRPDGSYVITTPRDYPQGRMLSVSHYRADGLVIRVTGYSYDPSGPPSAPYSPNLPVTAEQLTALATDPALHL